jgi:hypothetical protein
MQRAPLFVVAAVVAVSIVISIRVVLTTHQVPRWQEDLARGSYRFSIEG